MSTPTLKGSVAARIVGLTTELNSLASGSLVVSSVNGTSGVFSNNAGDAAGEGAPYLRLKYHQAALGGAATAGTVVDGWFLGAADGSVYESGSASITPARNPDFVFPEIAQSAAQDIEVIVPAPISTHFKLLFRNNTIGQALAASGNTLDLYPTTDTYPSV